MATFGTVTQRSCPVYIAVNTNQAGPITKMPEECQFMEQDGVLETP